MEFSKRELGVIQVALEDAVKYMNIKFKQKNHWYVEELEALLEKMEQQWSLQNEN